MELGADILFIDQDHFGVNELCAIQLKVGGLSARRDGKPSRKTTEIIGQALVGIMAERYVDRARFRVSRFYIVIDGELNPHARFYIDQVNHNFPHLQVIEKDDLE